MKRESRMNNLQIFSNPEFGQIRTVEIDGEPWFVGKDVAQVLGYERATKAVSDRVDEEDRDEIPIQDSIGRMQNTPIINESGLYSLILSSKLPTAKRFKRWVTSEVLPAIRKTGSYGASETINVSVTETDKLIRCAEIMAGCLSGNRQYVLNIIRHIVPDVDEVQNVSDLMGQGDIEVPVTNDIVTQTTVNNRGTYKKPFNHNQFNNYLIEHGIKCCWLQMELGCSSGIISKWAYGQSKPTEYYRIKLCRVLNLPPGYFDNSKRVRRIRKKVMK